MSLQTKYFNNALPFLFAGQRFYNDGGFEIYRGSTSYLLYFSLNICDLLAHMF